MENDMNATNVTAPVTKEPLSADFGLNDAALLARDLVMSLLPLQDVLKKHQLSLGQYETLKEVAAFNTMIENFTAEWESISNTPQRLAFQALTGVERSLPHVAARMRDEKEPLSSVTQTLKLYAEIGGMVGQQQKGQGAPGEKFVININLGDEVQTFEKTFPSAESLAEIQQDAEGNTTVVALPAFGSTPASTSQIQSLTEGSAEDVALQPRPSKISGQ